MRHSMKTASFCTATTVVRGSIALTAALALAAAAALGGCDQDASPYGSAPAATTDGNADSASSDGFVDPNARRERTSTYGRAVDAAERTRDRIQERDAETGRLADEIFD